MYNNKWRSVLISLLLVQETLGFKETTLLLKKQRAPQGGSLSTIN